MFVQYENLGGPCYLTLGNIEEQRISHPAGYKQGCYAAGREQNQNSNRHDHGFKKKTTKEFGRSHINTV